MTTHPKAFVLTLLMVLVLMAAVGCGKALDERVVLRDGSTIKCTNAWATGWTGSAIVCDTPAGKRKFPRELVSEWGDAP